MTNATDWKPCYIEGYRAAYARMQAGWSSELMEETAATMAGSESAAPLSDDCAAYANLPGRIVMHPDSNVIARIEGER